MGKLVPSDDTKISLERKLRLYESQLPGSRGEKYLEARGITSAGQSFFRLGFVQDPEPEDVAARGRISIPYLTATGCVGIKYRAIDDSPKKYLNNPGFYANRMFNPLFLTSRHRTIYICEGEIDTITLAQFRVPAVGFPGSGTFDTRLWRVFRNRRVIVLADDDEAGNKLANRILTAVDSSANIVMEGHDVNSFYTLNGKDELFRKIGWDDREDSG